MSAIRYALILALIFLPASPFATTFPVTKTEDTDDGICDADCSLREAIEAANTNPGADDVPVPAGTYLLTLGQLEVSDDASIAGVGQANTIIDGNRRGRVFDIRVSGAVEISNITIQNGFVHERGGGGIYHYGDLTLTNSTVRDNRVDGFYCCSGGGILGMGDLTLTNSTVTNNHVTGWQSYHGGGILGSGVLTLTDSTVSNNSVEGSYGGWAGIRWHGDATLTNSRVHNNSDFGDFRSSASLTATNVTLTNSTVSNNISYGKVGVGAGISAGNVTLINSRVTGNTNMLTVGGGINGRVVTIINSTVSNNTAGDYGGGIVATNVTLTNSTVSNNTAGDSGGGIRSFSLTLANTIVADNETYSGFGSNCDSDTVYSLGYNLTDDDSCGFTEPGDLVVADAMLGRLQLNGGHTRTHALLPGSPAIDAGSPDCPPPATDQRGVVRPQGAACDIGAFELEVEFISVEIDIRPGSDANPINQSGRGNLPVAILGSDTFDVLDVDVATLAFGPDAAAPSHDLAKPGTFENHLRDVDGDGFTDLVSHYRTQDTGISRNDAEACITGETLAGSPFEGCDVIRAVSSGGRVRR